MLFGRRDEKRAIDEALASARAGDGTALVLHGVPGCGKSALLRYATTSATDMTVLRAAGVQVEAELPYAALHMLLRPLLSDIDALPAPQAAALRRAFGMEFEGETNRFAVGLATLTLLSEAADPKPILCLMDDAQWLDLPSAHAIGFAARRLDADRVAVLFATRALSRDHHLDGLPVLPVPGLDRDACAELLDAVGVPARLREHLITGTEGNPLALRELSRNAASDESSALSLPLNRKLQDIFTADIDTLSPHARTLLLIAAAEDTGDLDVVLRATEALADAPGARLGIPALDEVVAGELVELTGDRITFRHPLIRAAVYQSATPPRRRAIHNILSHVFNSDDDADRRAWHAAAGVTGTDDLVADDLAASAERAVDRGGQAAAVSILARAAELSSSDETRARRLVAAAQAAGDSGQHDRTRDLTARAEPLVTDPLLASQLAELAAEEHLLYGSVHAARERLYGAARAVASVDGGRAVILVTHLTNAAIGWGADDWVSEAVDLLSSIDFAPGDHIGTAAAACEGIREILAGDATRGVDLVRAMVKPMVPLRSSMTGARTFAATLAGLTGDDDIAAEINETLAEECRRGGMIGWLPTIHSALSDSLIRLGHFRDARVSLGEGLRVADELGQTRMSSLLAANRALLAAMTGEPIPDDAPVDPPWAAGAGLGHDAPGWALATRQRAMAHADLVSGRYDNAVGRWESIADTPAVRTTAAWAWAPEVVEAASRAGNTRAAGRATEVFARWATACRRSDLLALLERCHALTGNDSEAGQHFATAVAMHEAAPRPFDAARTALLYGEWLRRDRGRAEARRQLRAAVDGFERVGATAWADRARLELRATGETRLTRGAHPDLRDKLTPQELQVARLAATGATNRDIGARLFLSPRTVGHHLYKAFPKLGVANRAELAKVFGEATH